MQTINVTLKRVHGFDTIMPACKVAEQFAAIAGTENITKVALAHIKARGYNINLIQEVKTI
jgi:hypothetical protein